MYEGIKWLFILGKKNSKMFKKILIISQLSTIVNNFARIFC